MDEATQLEGILRDTPWFMEALLAARTVDAPDWLIGAGALRTAVWDRLHGFETPTPLSDIDLVFFDPMDLTSEREHQVEARLFEALPDAPWEAKNHAAVHLWYPKRFGYAVEPLTSTADAVGTWPETATSIGVRLEADDHLAIVAPMGLGDLLGLLHRRNPRRVSVEEYERRLSSKRICERWPRVTVVPARANTLTLKEQSGRP